jgi:transposase InsO family protein
MYRTSRLTIWGRRHLLDEAARIGVSHAARNMGVSRNTVYRWRRRGDELADRPCRPHRSPRRTSFEREAALLAARWQWRWGPDRIGPMTGIPRRTAYRILRRFGAHRLRELFPRERPVRGTFVVTAPGEVVQIDIKSLGRLSRAHRHDRVGHGKATTGHDRRVGYDHLHVAVDAASRRTYIEVRDGMGALDCAGFVRNAVAHFDAIGIQVRRVLTDNGSGYKRTFGEACRAAGVRWTRTKPYHPWTNGRVERFIGTIQRECLEQDFSGDDERRYVLNRWLAFYNRQRPHTALGGLSPERWLRAQGVTSVSAEII